ncbi:caldesmon-like [Camellia sinensis]|uniref:caldesmon-like n=1 Tax=Camellia sinensis TaxID=4442 RepID=UPI0010356F98|nr:caldesmon-like [Camellia sinensis]
MKTLEDQAEGAIKAQNDAEEKAESAEAIKKVLEAEKREAEEKTAQAQKELQEALATKDAELQAADEKGYNEGVADVTADYEKQAIQHAHSFSVQAFESRQELADKKREVSSLQKTNKNLQSKMKTLEDQVEAAIKAQNDAEEKAEFAEAIKKVLEAEKREAEEKTAQAQKKLQEALATKDAELQVADEKGYNEGVADVTTDYEKQVKQGEEVPKDATPEKALSDMSFADKSLDVTL